MLCKNCGHDNPLEARFCATCGTPLVPLWLPGVVSSYKNAWRQLWKNILELFLILIISWVIGLPAGAGRFGGAGAVLLGILALPYGILIVGPIGQGVAFAYLKAARGDELQVKDIFEVFHNYWNAVLASLLVGAIVSVGFALLIVPGIVFACKLAFTPHLVVDRKMAVIAAVKESWRMTGGHAWKVFLIGLLAIPICIAGVICFGVGIIVAIMWVGLALASLYHAVSRLGEASSQQGVPVT